MSQLEKFLAGELENLPNDTKNTFCGESSINTHHKHHRCKNRPAHSVMHGLPNPLFAKQNGQFTNKNERIEHLSKETQTTCDKATAPSQESCNMLPNQRHTFCAQHCLPCHQKNASDFLKGSTPGVMAFYAPEEQQHIMQHPCPQPANIRANTRPDNATVESQETVQKLVSWREEASY